MPSARIWAASAASRAPRWSDRYRLFRGRPGPGPMPTRRKLEELAKRIPPLWRSLLRAAAVAADAPAAFGAGLAQVGVALGGVAFVVARIRVAGQRAAVGLAAAAARALVAAARRAGQRVVVFGSSLVRHGTHLRFVELALLAADFSDWRCAAWALLAFFVPVLAAPRLPLLRVESLSEEPWFLLGDFMGHL